MQINTGAEIQIFQVPCSQVVPADNQGLLFRFLVICVSKAIREGSGLSFVLLIALMIRNFKMTDGSYSGNGRLQLLC